VASPAHSGAPAYTPVVSQSKNVKPKDQPFDTLSSLSVDLLSAKALVWIASVGRDAELTPEAHIYSSIAIVDWRNIIGRAGV
jgi:hypothetical protein